MTKRMLADVLWDAANLHLHHEEGESSLWGGTKCVWSCNAIALAAGVGNSDHLSEKQLAFLSSLGCDTDSVALQATEQRNDERQGVRYVWLLLAMHVAEDEGVTL